MHENIPIPHNPYCCRLQELEDGTEPVQHSTTPSPVHVPTEHYDYSRPANSRHHVETESSSAHTPSHVSPIASPPVPTSRPDTRDLEAKLKLESRIIELRSKNKDETEARRRLEQQIAALENSKMEDMKARCKLEQRVHDLQEENSQHKEHVSQLLATPPLVSTVAPLNADVLVLEVNNNAFSTIRQTLIIYTGYDHIPYFRPGSPIIIIQDPHITYADLMFSVAD